MFSPLFPPRSCGLAIRWPWLGRHAIRAVAASALVLAPSTVAVAHEIPSAVTAFVFVKAQGERLRVLVRVPLESMRDVDFPTRGLGYLDFDAARPLARDAAEQWILNALEIFEDGQALTGTVVATRLSLPSERTFGSYDAALTHVLSPSLPATTDVPWQQALLDVLLEYPIASSAAQFSIRPGLAHLGIRTTTVLRYVAPDGAERAFQYHGSPGLVQLDPRWHQAAGRFITLGIEHILGGIDHLLFVFCLVIPFRRWRPLVVIVTSFTVAHSITLIAAALGLAPGALWFPPLIEALIAASIVYMAVENIVGAKLERRWLVAFGFGLVHGFGFSFALGESLQFAGAHLLTSLVAFNVGVEIGQLAVLAVAIPALGLLFRRVVAERLGTIILSVLIAHTAWHWMTERATQLREFDFSLPVADGAFLATAMRMAMLVLIVGLAWWLLALALARQKGPEAPTAGPAGD